MRRVDPRLVEMRIKSSIIILIQSVKKLDGSSDDLVLLFHHRNRCNAIIVLKTIVRILTMVASFDDKE